MKIYFAPLEGITTYTYRNVHHDMFGMCDAYFAPFITPTANERLSAKNMRGILPQNNTATIRVQCLASSGEAFVTFTKRIVDLGYEEVNLNLGCPSGTVVNKGRGAGAFQDLTRLNQFLEYIFTYGACNISIKTRTGFSSHEEFERIMNIYNQYPVAELIVHPRFREEFYGGVPNKESFLLAYNTSCAKLCYNGDIFSREDYGSIMTQYPKLHGIMIGRGAVRNPAIFREIQGGAALTTEELLAFSAELERRYLPLLESQTNTLHKLKEVWAYVITNYPQEGKIAKAIKKAKTLGELHSAIQWLPSI
ncbi:MAG: tRNA-dihydrouridine synthase family protein [Ruminococcaceae bacterium]|nr:tRNA-dihydrouridine synthase family protein [Oscillospiraceae bacterium]